MTKRSGAGQADYPDIALVGHPNDNTMVAHKIDCPVARKAAANGLPVMSLIGPQAPLPDDIPRHSCLNDE